MLRDDASHAGLSSRFGWLPADEPFDRIELADTPERVKRERGLSGLMDAEELEPRMYLAVALPHEKCYLPGSLPHLKCNRARRVSRCGFKQGEYIMKPKMTKVTRTALADAIRSRYQASSGKVNAQFWRSSSRRPKWVLGLHDASSSTESLPIHWRE